MDDVPQKANPDGIKFSNDLLSISSIIIAICWLRFTHWIGYMAIPPLCAMYYLFRPSHHMQVGFWWIVLSFTRTGPRYEGICYCMEPCWWWSHTYGILLTAWFCALAYYEARSKNMAHYSVVLFMIAFVCPSESELVTCEENHIIVWVRLVCWLTCAMLPLHYVYQSLSLADAKKTDVRVPRKIFTASLSASLFLCLPLMIWPLALFPLLIEYKLLSELWLVLLLFCGVHVLFYIGLHWIIVSCGLGVVALAFAGLYLRKRYTFFQFSVPPEVAQEGVTAPEAVGGDG